MHTITLFTESGSWFAQHSDPSVFELFGTTTIVTAFTDKARSADVLSSIQALNPDRIVSVDEFCDDSI